VFGIVVRIEQDLPVQVLGYLNGHTEQRIRVQWSPRNAVVQGQPIQKLHRDVGLLATLADVVNRADVGMVEGGGGTSFTSEAFQCLGVSGNVIWQELQRDKTPKLGVLGLVNDAHTAAAELLDDVVARNGLADHWPESYVAETGQVNESGGVERS
jgi:hypothetical protein